MPRPTRHKVTGIYQFRQRVPKHLIPLVGKNEEKASLGTRVVIVILRDDIFQTLSGSCDIVHAVFVDRIARHRLSP
ncbi:DUF6538 domain-containing protein [Rhizobium leguminosarum]|uniref:DUF6538 domain-containing protein n=1 Tax=Rhizobium leguminosarum TaxID=384 RepID=UPI003D7C347B